MTDERKAWEKATNAHFMAVLAGAISEAGLTYKDVDERMDFAPGTTGRWMRNEQTMRQPMFVRMAVVVEANPRDLMTRAMTRLEASGLLDGVEVDPEGD